MISTVKELMKTFENKYTFGFIRVMFYDSSFENGILMWTVDDEDEIIYKKIFHGHNHYLFKSSDELIKRLKQLNSFYQK